MVKPIFKDFFFMFFPKNPHNCNPRGPHDSPPSGSPGVSLQQLREGASGSAGHPKTVYLQMEFSTTIQRLWGTPMTMFPPPCRFLQNRMVFHGFPDAMKLSCHTQHFDLILGQSVLLSFLRQRCTNELQAVCRKLPEESFPPDFKLSEGVSFGEVGLVNCPKLGKPSQVYPILHLWDGQLNSIWMFNPQNQLRNSERDSSSLSVS